MTRANVALDEHLQTGGLSGWIHLWEDPLSPALEPQRVIGRPRKAAPKPGRKFSGMTRFSWRQK